MMKKTAVALSVLAGLVVLLAALESSLTPRSSVLPAADAPSTAPLTPAANRAALADNPAPADATASTDEAAGPDNPMREQLAEIAHTYRENSRFPTYSQPLARNDWAALNPRAHVPEERPLANAPSLTVSILLPYYVVDAQRDLPVKVVVARSGDDGAAPLSVTAVQAVARNQTLAGAPVLLPMVRQQGNVDTFAGAIPASELSAFADSEVEIAALLTLSDGRHSSATTMIRLFHSTATLTGVGAAYVDDVHLVIPVFLQVMQAGMYRLQANLFSADGEPVAHLNTTLTLAAGTVTGLLNVHSATLREQNAPGPYLLTDINLMQMPSAPGEPTRYGSSLAEHYPVNGFPLDSYHDTPYQDPAAQQRLEFLEKLSAEGLNP